MTSKEKDKYIKALKQHFSVVLGTTLYDLKLKRYTLIERCLKRDQNYLIESLNNTKFEYLDRSLTDGK
jgi:hypothetical protein